MIRRTTFSDATTGVSASPVASARHETGSPVDWQHLFGRFREGQPRFPELDRRHVAQRRVDPEVVVPVHVVREPGTQLARRAERLAEDELGPQYPVGRLVDGAVMGAAPGRQRPLYAEGLEHQVDLGVVELAAAVRVEDLDVRDGEEERPERRLDRPGVLPGPGGVADDLPVAEVDEQADVVPRGPDAHVGQVAAYMGARRPAAEAARDDIRHVGLVYRPGVHLEPLPAVCTDQAVLPHDAADPAPADGGADPSSDAFILRGPYRPLLAAWAASAWSSTSTSRHRGACTAPIWGGGPRWPLWPSLSSACQRRSF